MKRIKAKQEQFKRLQEIDERKVHHGNTGLELRDSFVEPNLNNTTQTPDKATSMFVYTDIPDTTDPGNQRSSSP